MGSSSKRHWSGGFIIKSDGLVNAHVVNGADTVIRDFETA